LITRINKITACRCNAIGDIFLGKMPLERATHAKMNLEVDQADTARKSDPRPPAYVWFGGVAVRTVFLIVLTLLTARVASPQIENLSSLHETPGDLIRVLMGIGVCAWFIVNLFILPKDAGAYRTWMYLGLAVLPLTVLCAFVVW
jgi:hypothetical protein